MMNIHDDYRAPVMSCPLTLSNVNCEKSSTPSASNVRTDLSLYKSDKATGKLTQCYMRKRGTIDRPKFWAVDILSQSFFLVRKYSFINAKFGTKAQFGNKYGNVEIISIHISSIEKV